jgi:hypothetical protein
MGEERDKGSEEVITFSNGSWASDSALHSEETAGTASESVGEEISELSKVIVLSGTQSTEKIDTEQSTVDMKGAIPVVTPAPVRRKVQEPQRLFDPRSVLFRVQATRQRAALHAVQKECEMEDESVREGRMRRMEKRLAKTVKDNAKESKTRPVDKRSENAGKAFRDKPMSKGPGNVAESFISRNDRILIRKELSVRKRSLIS